MTNREIGVRLGEKAREERRITSEILDLILQGLEQRAYLEHGYSSMLDWLVRGFSYSSSAAFRRIEAARLMRAVPDAKEKLKSGVVNLSTLSRAQTVIRAQEKQTGMVSGGFKKEIVEKIENLSSQAAEQVLLKLMPEAASTVYQERRTVVNESTVRHSMNLPKEVSENLKRAKEILSHKLPHASDADVLAYALEFLLDRTDPLRKEERGNKSQTHHNASIAAAATGCVTKAGSKRLIIKKSNGACAFKDRKTGTICGSRYQLQLDHIIPKALGGGDEPENLRPLCRQHNLLMAEKKLGKEAMRKFWPAERSS